VHGSLFFLQNLSSLTYLNVYGNIFTGNLPLFDKTTYLNVAFNKLSGKINSVPSSLEIAEFWSNEFTGTIPNFTINTPLQVLKMNDNRFTGSIPQSLGSLGQLEVLSLHFNDLEGRIPDLSRLGRLTGLFLHSNRFTGILPDLPASLHFLHLYSNQLSGPFPLSFSRLSNLRVLDMHANPSFISILPWHFTQFTSLAHLALGDMSLVGSIPSLTSLTDLTVLELENNQLFGTFPNLIRMENINRVNLANLQLEGTIPEYLGHLTRLNKLNLEGCGLTGTLPLSVLESQAIKCLQLDGNDLIEVPNYCLDRLDWCCDWISSTTDPFFTTTTSQATPSKIDDNDEPSLAEDVGFIVAMMLLSLALILICVGMSSAAYFRRKFEQNLEMSESLTSDTEEEGILLTNMESSNI